MVHLVASVEITIRVGIYAGHSMCKGYITCDHHCTARILSVRNTWKIQNFLLHSSKNCILFAKNSFFFLSPQRNYTGLFYKLGNRDRLQTKVEFRLQPLVNVVEV